MVLEWWERYCRIILPAAAVVLIASSLWLYQARPDSRKDMSAQLPLIPPAYASEDEELLSGEGVFSTGGAAAGNMSARKATAATQPAAPDPAFGASGAAGASGASGAKNKAAAPQAMVAQPAEPSSSPLYVDVKGSVRQPGLYRMVAGMRVADAIAKAGGAKPEADLDQLNLAAPLVDGTAIVIPAKGSSVAPPLSGASGGASTSAPAGVSSPAYAANHAGSAAPAPEQPILLNTATLEQLMTLPGIGEARAKAILQYREEKGGFRSPEELRDIEGIGDKLFARIKDRIRIR